jgi:hypothetical protein
MTVLSTEPGDTRELMPPCEGTWDLRPDGALSVSCRVQDEARAVFHQIVSAVSYAHNHHICHRDLKLDNVLLTREGTAHVKVRHWEPGFERADGECCGSALCTVSHTG